MMTGGVKVVTVAGPVGGSTTVGKDNARKSMLGESLIRYSIIVSFKILWEELT